MTDFRLRLPAYVLIGLGLFSAATVIPALTPVLTLFLDLAFFPVDGAPGASDAAHCFLAGTLGGLCVGWGVSLLAIVQGRSLRIAVIAGGIAWFLTDSTASALSGAPMNALYNLGFLAVFLLPLTAKEG
jgi:hypothetical protein